MQQQSVKATVMDAAALGRAISRISFEILERNRGAGGLCLLGILGKGPHVAERIARRLGQLEGVSPPVGKLDVTPHRDDPGRRPDCDHSQIPFGLEGMRVVLVDDVIHTGRTVRAAIDAIMARGRPACIQLAVLVDRGHRELPIRADYVGKNLPSSQREHVQVRLAELGGDDSVVLLHANPAEITT